MKPGDRIAEHGDHEFTILAGELTPAEARAVVKGPGVVVDDNGTVLGTVTAPELAGANADTLTSWRALPPAVEVHADQTYAELADSPAITLLLLGITRLVLTRGGKPVGVLPVARVSDYLASGAHPLSSNEMGPAGASADGALPGRVRLAIAHVVCVRCGYRNTLEHWNPRRPPRCANPDGTPHDLELGG